MLRFKECKDCKRRYDNGCVYSDLEDTASLDYCVYHVPLEDIEKKV